MILEKKLNKLDFKRVYKNVYLLLHKYICKILVFLF